MLTANPDTRFDPFPLTQARQPYFVGCHSAFTFGGVACRSYLEIVFHQPITQQQIAKAFNQLIARDDMLRVVIEEEGYQRVLPQVVTFSPQNTTIGRKSPRQRCLCNLMSCVMACWPRL